MGGAASVVGIVVSSNANDSWNVVNRGGLSTDKHTSRVESVIERQSESPLTDDLEHDALRQKVGQGVIEALQAQGYANVMIILAELPSTATPQARARHDVVHLQDQVLSTFGPNEFVVRQRYETIPALAGRVTRAGLAKLVANAKVVKIDLDVGGAGGR
jgi:hypothetical protein